MILILFLFLNPLNPLSVSLPFFLSPFICLSACLFFVILNLILCATCLRIKIPTIVTLTQSIIQVAYTVGAHFIWTVLCPEKFLSDR